MREIEPFQPDEELYRRVDAAHVAGSVIAVDAVEMPACSFNRSRFSRPGDVLADGSRHIAFMAADNLPDPIRREPPAKDYEFFLEDAPEENNAAHCEARIRPVGEEFRPKVKSVIKQMVRLQLVQKLNLLDT
jgi:hypothetical protein